jgi:hypothetical protein
VNLQASDGTGTTRPLSDPEVALVALDGNANEVGDGGLGLARGQNDQAVAFAQKMINDHSMALTHARATLAAMQIASQQSSASQQRLVASVKPAGMRRASRNASGGMISRESALRRRCNQPMAEATAARSVASRNGLRKNRSARSPLGIAPSGAADIRITGIAASAASTRIAATVCSPSSTGIR